MSNNQKIGDVNLLKKMMIITVRDGMGLAFVKDFRFWSILFGWAGRLKNGISNSFYLVFFSMLSPLAKFHQNRTKNTEVRNFHFWTILVGRAGRSKNGRRYFKLILCCFCSINRVCKSSARDLNCSDKTDDKSAY